MGTKNAPVVSNRFADAVQVMNEQNRAQSLRSQVELAIDHILNSKLDMSKEIEKLKTAIEPLQSILLEAKQACSGVLTSEVVCKFEPRDMWYQGAWEIGDSHPYCGRPALTLIIPAVCFQLKFKKLVFHLNALYALANFDVWNEETGEVFHTKTYLTAFLKKYNETQSTGWPRIPLYYCWVENAQGRLLRYQEDVYESTAHGSYIPTQKKTTDLAAVSAYIERVFRQSHELVDK